ncbi:hypothetical protein SDC9_63750 [bioreactor metagenome]|uniref:Uncharacterized protein n=1 Tax=bioreactor metagenome TaxID=1076179 RepID=A0A644XNH9_9ZZZZ
MQNELRFKIGEIEFEARGEADIIAREREAFVNNLLPIAVDAIARTKASHQSGYIEEQETIENISETEILQIESKLSTTNTLGDLSRKSLSNFISQNNVVSDQDFVIFAAYYDEKRNNTKDFSSEDVKRFYSEARKPEYSNISMLMNILVKKGFIMDSPASLKSIPKKYILTAEGINYVQTFEPKESINIKKGSLKSKKPRAKIESVFTNLSADDLHLKNYPEIKSQKNFKNQMLLTLYVVSNEGLGDAFSVDDVQCIMTDILGLPATNDQIGGVFKNNRTWFKSEPDPKNKKAYKRKLLQGAKDFAQSIIEGENC